MRRVLVLMGILALFLAAPQVSADHIVAVITYTPSADVTINKPLDFVPLQSGGTSPYTCNWDFGDGETTSICSPTKTYTRAGQYTITLSGTDVTAHAYSTSKIIDVGTGTYVGGGSSTTITDTDSSADSQPSTLPVVGGSTLLILGVGVVAYLGLKGRKRVVGF